MDIQQLCGFRISCYEVLKKKKKMLLVNVILRPTVLGIVTITGADPKHLEPGAPKIYTPFYILV